MARRYQEPVTVTLTADGTPASFTWRGKLYTVKEVLETWHLQDRWWDRQRRGNRYYYRLEVQQHMIFELFIDVAQRPPAWVLDVVHD